MMTGMWLWMLVCQLAVVWAPWPAGVGVMGLLVGLAGLVWCFERPERVRIPLASLAGVAIALLGVWQMWSGGTLYGYGTEVRVVAWLGASWTMFLAGNGSRRSEELRDGLVVLGMVVGVVGVFHMLTSEHRMWWVIPSPTVRTQFAPFVNPDHGAMFLELIAPMAAANLLGGRRVLFSMCGLGVMTGAAVATGSRAGTGAFAVLLVVLFVAKMRKGGMDRAMAGLLVLTGLMIYAAGWERVWGKLQMEDQMQTRRELNEASYRMIQEGPALGRGLGTWRYAYASEANPRVGGDVEAAHNEWLQMGVEGGWLAVAALSVIGMWSVYRCLDRPWGWGVVLFLAHAALDFPLQTPALHFCWALVTGLLAGEAVQAKRGAGRVGGARQVRETGMGLGESQPLVQDRLLNSGIG